MADAVITVKDLNYYYPGTKALEDVSFTINKGDITALVGPNGSGKTTMLRTLAGLDTPFSGKIEVANTNVLTDPRQAHTKIGYLSDDFGLYKDLVVKDVLEFIGGCHGLKDQALNDRIKWVTDLLRLEGVFDKKCGALSRGWRQRVGIAMSIVHKPEILLLDEPASGLDPEARAELSAVMLALQAEGITSLVSSHILAELEEYCTSMLVLRNGKIQKHVLLQEHRKTQKASLQITVLGALTEAQNKTVNDVAGQEAVEVSKDDQTTTISIVVDYDHDANHALLKKLISKKIPVCGFTLKEVTLQRLYLETSALEEGDKP